MKLWHKLPFINLNNRSWSKNLQKNIVEQIQDQIFKNRVNNQWNSLPQFVISSNNLNKFKNILDQYWKETGCGQSKRPLAYFVIVQC